MIGYSQRQTNGKKGQNHFVTSSPSRIDDDRTDDGDSVQQNLQPQQRNTRKRRNLQVRGSSQSKDNGFRALLETSFRLDQKTTNTLTKKGNLFKETKSRYVLLTGGSWSYRGAVFNWIKHTEARGIKSYLVLCFDELLYRYIGAKHGVLVRNAAGTDYTSGALRRKEYIQGRKNGSIPKFTFTGAVILRRKLSSKDITRTVQGPECEKGESKNITRSSGSDSLTVLKPHDPIM
jgi:hypothetical protein